MNEDWMKEDWMKEDWMKEDWMNVRRQINVRILEGKKIGRRFKITT